MKGLLAFLILLVTFGAPNVLHAEMMVLPFDLRGRPDPELFDRRVLPAELQEAAHFLFHSVKRYPLMPLDRTFMLWNRMGRLTRGVLDRRKSRAVCRSSDASYLLAGSVHFITSRRIRVNISIFSCRAGRRVERWSRVGRLSELQQLMRRGIAAATPFAGNIASELRVNPVSRAAVDLAVILDTSGNMDTDLPVIRRGLGALRERLPTGSRLGILSLKGGKRRVLPFTADWNRIRNFLRESKPSGRVAIGEVAAALRVVADYGRWKGIRKLMIFTNAATGGERRRSIESSLRSLAMRGVRPHLYALLEQTTADRREWARVSRTLGLEDPAVLYGRRVGFLDGTSRYVIMNGRRFYMTARNARPDIQANYLNTRDLLPLETAGLDPNARGSAALDELPRKYAKSRNTKVVPGQGKIISGLERKIEKAALAGTTRSKAPYKVLLTSRGRSFWIRVSNRGDYRRLRDLVGRPIHLGLRFLGVRGPDGILLNHPDYIYVAGERTPRLFVNRWRHLNNLPAGLARPRDIWFLRVRIKAFKDVRRRTDIR